MIKWIVLAVLVGCALYVHFRGRHGWPADRARRVVVDLVLHGIATERKERS